MKHTLYISLFTSLSLSVITPGVAMDRDGASKNPKKQVRFRDKPPSRFATKKTNRFDPPETVSYSKLCKIYTPDVVKSNNPHHEHDKDVTYRPVITDFVGVKVRIKIDGTVVYASHKDTSDSIKRKKEAIFGNSHAVAILSVPDTRSIVTMGKADFESVGGIYTLYDSSTKLPILTTIESWDYSTGAPSLIDKSIETTVHLTFTKRKGK